MVAATILLTIWNCYNHEYIMRSLFYSQLMQRQVQPQIEGKLMRVGKGAVSVHS